MSRELFDPLSLNVRHKYHSGTYYFKGVDLTSSPFDVSTSRGIKSLNFIHRDNFTQVRKGYEQKVRFKKDQYFNAITKRTETNTSVKVHDLWELVDREGNRHLIAHVGCLLYEIKDIDGDTPSYQMIKSGNAAYPVVDKSIDAFVDDHMMFILGGIKYLRLSFNGNAYHIIPVDELIEPEIKIPTTTISITEDNSAISSRSGLDGVNLLTKWRYNRLHTGLKTTSEKNFSYTLDAPIICSPEQEDKDMSEFFVKVKMKGTKGL